AARTWNAIRCALFGPTPGRRPRSSVRSWTAPSYTSPAYVPPPTRQPLARSVLRDDRPAAHPLDERGRDEARVLGVGVVHARGVVGEGDARHGRRTRWCRRARGRAAGACARGAAPRVLRCIGARARGGRGGAARRPGAPGGERVGLVRGEGVGLVRDVRVRLRRAG